MLSLFKNAALILITILFLYSCEHSSKAKTLANSLVDELCSCFKGVEVDGCKGNLNNGWSCLSKISQKSGSSSYSTSDLTRAMDNQCPAEASKLKLLLDEKHEPECPEATKALTGEICSCFKEIEIDGCIENLNKGWACFSLIKKNSGYTNHISREMENQCPDEKSKLEILLDEKYDELECLEKDPKESWKQKGADKFCSCLKKSANDEHSCYDFLDYDSQEGLWEAVSTVCPDQSDKLPDGV